MNGALATKDENEQPALEWGFQGYVI